MTPLSSSTFVGPMLLKRAASQSTADHNLEQLFRAYAGTGIRYSELIKGAENRGVTEDQAREALFIAMRPQWADE